MAKFKVGDRVRRVTRSTWPEDFGHLGQEYTIQGFKGDHLVIFDGCDGASPGAFELVTPAITIKPGKHYRLRNGKVTGRVSDGDIGFEALVDGQVKVFDKAGGAVFGGEDIVEAWVPKVGERVRMTNVVDGHKADCGATIVDEEVGTYLPLLIKFDAAQSWAHGGGGQVPDNHGYWVRASDIEPLLVAAPAQPAVDDRADAGGGFKAGDKIRCVSSPASPYCEIGDEFVAIARTGLGVGASSSVHYTGKNGEVTWRPGSYFELIKPAAPLKIEAGRYYKTRDGRKVGPMKPFIDDRFIVQIGDGNIWFVDGKAGPHNHDAENLVAEWVDEAVAASNDNAAPAKPKFKAGDRVVAVGDENDIGTVTKYADGLYAVAWSSHGSRPHDDLIWDEDELVAAPAPTAAIVALIEDGVGKPSSKPKVHASQADAADEAERLALAHPGQLFGVFVLADSKIADVVNVPTPVLRAA